MAQPAARPEIRFVCQPRDDVAFAEHVAAIATELTPEATGRELQARLRHLYPKVVVAPLGRLAPIGETAVRYVYRDGTDQLVQAAGEWWLDEGLPRIAIDDDGRIVEANEPALEFLRVRHAVGRRYAEFVPEDAAGDMELLLVVMRRHQRCDSSHRLVAADGTVRDFLLHTVGGEGRQDATYLPLDPRWRESSPR